MLGWGELALGGYQDWQLGDCDADLSPTFSIDKTFERFGHLPLPGQRGRHPYKWEFPLQM